MLTRPTRKAPLRGSPERAALGKQDRCGYLPETLWDPVRLFPPENRRVRVSIWTTWVPPPPPPFRPHHYHLPAQDSKHLLWEANASFPLHSWDSCSQPKGLSQGPLISISPKATCLPTRSGRREAGISRQRVDQLRSI